MSFKTFNDVSFDLAQQFENLARVRGVSKVARGETPSTQTTGGFFQMAKKVNGDRKKLQNMPIKSGSTQNWWQRRNNFCSRHAAEQRQQQTPLVEKSRRFQGTPSRRQLGMICWMCSNIPETQLRQMIPRVKMLSGKNTSEKTFENHRKKTTRRIFGSKNTKNTKKSKSKNIKSNLGLKKNTKSKSKKYKKKKQNQNKTLF